MDKFLQEFKDQLENQTPPDFVAADWEDMAYKLDHPNQQNLWKYLPWVLSALLLGITLLLLTINWLTWQKLSTTHRKMDRLTSSLDSINSLQLTNSTDTVYLVLSEKMANSYPTNSHTSKIEKIAYSSVQYQQANNYPTTTLKPLFRSNTSNQNPANQPLNESRFTPLLYPSTSFHNNPLFTHQQKQQNELRPALEEKNDVLPPSLIVNHLPPLIKEVTNHAPIVLPAVQLPANTHRRKTLQQLVYPLLPSATSLTAFTGIGQGIQAPKQQIPIFNNGLRLDFQYAQNWQFWLSASLHNHFIFDEEDDDYEDDFPDHPDFPYPSDDYELKGIAIDRQSWSADIGLRYAFRAQRKWQPFIGMGLGVNSFTRNTITYTLEEEDTDERVAVQITDELPQQAPYALAVSGLKYQPSTRWSFELEALLRYHQTAKDFQARTDLTTRLGVSYRIF